MWRDFHPSADRVLSAMALFGILLLSVLLTFNTPSPTSKELLFILIGALAGALTVGGGKVAEKITNSTGDNATVQPDAAAKPDPAEGEVP